MSEALKPCPFCNGPAVNVAGEYITCGSPTFLSCAGRSVRADIKDWNTRATPSQRLDAATVERLREALRATRGWVVTCSESTQARKDLRFIDAALATDPHQHGGGKGA